MSHLDTSSRRSEGWLSRPLYCSGYSTTGVSDAGPTQPTQPGHAVQHWQQQRGKPGHTHGHICCPHDIFFIWTKVWVTKVMFLSFTKVEMLGTLRWVVSLGFLSIHVFVFSLNRWWSIRTIGISYAQGGSVIQTEHQVPFCRASHNLWVSLDRFVVCWQVCSRCSIRSLNSGAPSFTTSSTTGSGRRSTPRTPASSSTASQTRPTTPTASAWGCSPMSTGIPRSKTPEGTLAKVR